MASILVFVGIPTAADVAAFPGGIFTNVEAALAAAAAAGGDDIVTIRGTVPLENVATADGNVTFAAGENLTILGQDALAIIETTKSSAAGVAQLTFDTNTFNVNLQNFSFNGKDGGVADGINSNIAIEYKGGTSGSLSNVTITDFGNDKTPEDGTGLQINSNTATNTTITVTGSTFSSLAGNAIDLVGAGPGKISLNVSNTTSTGNNEGGQVNNNRDIEVTAAAITTGFNLNVAGSTSVHYQGTGAANNFAGFGGDDWLQGLGGNDTLSGNDGNDTVGIVLNPATEELGDDKFSGGAGNDTVHGGAGNDTVTGGVGNDALFGDDGTKDTAVFAGNFDKYTIAFDKATQVFTLTGPDGTDTATGFEFYTFADKANVAADTLAAGVVPPPPPPPVTNVPTEGADTLFVTNAAGQMIDGLGGADQITGLAGPDTLLGSDGADALVGAGGNDSLSGGTGADTINSGDGNDTNDGGADADQIAGDAGNDLINLGDGFDFAVGGTGDDTIDGGEGFDQINGNDGNDLLSGGAGQGFDQLAGGDGNDTLAGGQGSDFMNGGAGADLFILAAGGVSGDVLADFQAGVDKLQLVGFGAGATLVANGNGTWTVKSAGGAFETFTAGAINPTDVTFVP